MNILLPSAGSDYVNFSLPTFVRIAWVSDSARQVWAPRLKALISACAKTELLAAAFGIRKCALALISGKHLPELEPLWQARGLSSIKLEQQPGCSPSGSSHFAVGRVQDIEDLEEAWNAGDTNDIGQLLGYPACCCRSFQEHCGTRKLLDLTFAMAANSLASLNHGTTIEASGPVFTNILWRPIGIHGVPHVPCQSNCAATCSLGQSFMHVASELGFHEEISWLRQVLSWPAEWSALHGIAEIKTPILKISTRTDATSKKLTVRRIGEDYPPEGARGLHFPYQTPQKTPATESPAFQRGLQQIGP